MKALKGHPSSHIEVIAQHRMWGSLLVFVFSMIASPALVSAEQNASLSPRAQTIFLAGTTDLKDGSFPAAVSAFKEFLKLDDRFAPAYLNLGLAITRSSSTKKPFQLSKRRWNWMGNYKALPSSSASTTARSIPLKKPSSHWRWR